MRLQQPCKDTDGPAPTTLSSISVSCRLKLANTVGHVREMVILTVECTKVCFNVIRSHNPFLKCQSMFMCSKYFYEC